MSNIFYADGVDGKEKCDDLLDRDSTYPLDHNDPNYMNEVTNLVHSKYIFPFLDSLFGKKEY